MAFFRGGGRFFVVAFLAFLALVPPVAATENVARSRPVAPDECINVGLAFDADRFDVYVSLFGVIGLGFSTDRVDPAEPVDRLDPAVAPDGTDVGVASAVFIVPEKCRENPTLNAVIRPPPSGEPGSSYVESAYGLLP